MCLVEFIRSVVEFIDREILSVVERSLDIKKYFKRFIQLKKSDLLLSYQLRNLVPRACLSRQIGNFSRRICEVSLRCASLMQNILLYMHIIWSPGID